MVIKYLGSKRTLVPVLGRIAEAVEAETAVDLFTGTTRVAQELKRRGLHVTAVDTATYSAVLGECFVSTDARDVDEKALDAALTELEALPGARGYFTETFCETARFLQPKNGRRVDAIRNAIEEGYAGSPLRPLLLTSLLLAADRVDSTTGLQMAFLKEWAPRAHRDLALRRPTLLSGPGRTVRGDALRVVHDLPPVDLAYLDPPYNQHRYVSNYHVWETLVRWDAPEHYGIACKRVDVRDDASLRSPFNSRATAPLALADLLGRVRASVVVVSYNDESWVSPDQMTRWLLDAGHEDVRLLTFDRKRYVGAQIGIHGPTGEKVGTVSRLRNIEYVFVAGDRDRVESAVALAGEAAGEVAGPVSPCAEPVATMRA
jgi:adenine-specific DNA-methyltransferase